jgi:hypothetical protein
MLGCRRVSQFEPSSRSNSQLPRLGLIEAAHPHRHRLQALLHSAVKTCRSHSAREPSAAAMCSCAKLTSHKRLREAQEPRAPHVHNKEGKLSLAVQQQLQRQRPTRPLVRPTMPTRCAARLWSSHTRGRATASKHKRPTARLLALRAVERGAAGLTGIQAKSRRWSACVAGGRPAGASGSSALRPQGSPQRGRAAATTRLLQHQRPILDGQRHSRHAERGGGGGGAPQSGQAAIHRGTVSRCSRERGDICGTENGRQHRRTTCWGVRVRVAINSAVNDQHKKERWSTALGARYHLPPYSAPAPPGTVQLATVGSHAGPRARSRARASSTRRSSFGGNCEWCRES